jgi:hypothetical protein
VGTNPPSSKYTMLSSRVVLGIRLRIRGALDHYTSTEQATTSRAVGSRWLRSDKETQCPFPCLVSTWPKQQFTPRIIQTDELVPTSNRLSVQSLLSQNDGNVQIRSTWAASFGRRCRTPIAVVAFGWGGRSCVIPL